MTAEFQTQYYSKTESSSGSESSILQGKWICGIVLLGSEHWDEFVMDASAHNSMKNVLPDRPRLIFDIYRNKTLTKQKEEKRKSPNLLRFGNPKNLHRKTKINFFKIWTLNDELLLQYQTFRV